MTEQTEEVQESQPIVTAEELEDLKRQLAEAKRAKAAEAERADRAESISKTTAEGRFRAEEDALTSEIKASETEVAHVEKDLSDAFEAQARGEEGAGARIAKLTGQLGRLQYKLGNLSDKKEALEARKEAAKAQPDPLAVFTPRTRAWIEKHPAFLSSEQFRLCCTEADARAKRLGMRVDSDEYFDSCEEYLADNGFADEVGRKPKRRETQTEESEIGSGMEEGQSAKSGASAEAPMERQNRVSTAAPASRKAPGQTQRPSGTRQLTPDEREAADSLFPDKPAADRYKYYADLKDRQLKNPRHSHLVNGE